MADRRGLLCFGGFTRGDWGLLWQRQQSVMTRLARRFEIYYVERFGTRRLGGAELVKALARRLLGGTGGESVETAEGLRFVAPRIAPFHASRFWRRRNVEALSRSIERAWPPGLERTVLWIYNPSYVALEYLKRTSGLWKRTVYDCVQRFEFNRYYPPDIGSIDREIARRVDLVFTDSRAIFEEKKPLNRNTHFIPQGVDFERFLWEGVNRTPPDEMRWMARPVLGYHGAWHQAFDETLVASALEAVAGSTFVFVGPTFGREKVFQQRFRSAVFLGPRDHLRLGRFVNSFDVCLIPYRMDEHTRGVFPTKFFEYVATGLPVVSTDLPDLRDYRDWVEIARDREEFARLARVSVGKERRPVEEVRSFVERHSWDRRVERMLELLNLD